MYIPSTEYDVRKRNTRPNTVPVKYARGVGNGPPLVLIHGLGGSGRWWSRNVEGLAKRFQVHALDLLSIGGNERAGEFVLHKAASQIKHWMEQQGLQAAHIVGHSMGGFLAAELAADYPQFVNKLVLVDAAIMPTRSGGFSSMNDSLRNLPYLLQSFGPSSLNDLARTGIKNMITTAHALFTADIRAKLFAIRAPTLVVWGKQDPMVPVSVGYEIARRLPPQKLVVINNAGHCPMWDRPEAFNRVVSDFLGA